MDKGIEGVEFGGKKEIWGLWWEKGRGECYLIIIIEGCFED